MNVEFRMARRGDLARLVGLLADDRLGAERERFEDPLPRSYGFEDSGGVVVGFLQITYLPYLTHQGAWRAQIEGVRVDSDARGSGIGAMKTMSRQRNTSP